jgi:hypothetical protein
LPNPFKPPETDSTKNPLPPAAAGSPLKAVLVGLAVDIGGSTLIGMLLSIAYAIQLQASGLSDSEVTDAMQHVPRAAGVSIVGTLLGALMSVAGGYVCARIVRRDEYRVGLVMAAACAVFGLGVEASQGVDDMTFLLMATGFACNLLGVKYGAERNRRDDAAPRAPARTRKP